MNEFLLHLCYITEMDNKKFIAIFIFGLIAGVLSNEEETEAEDVISTSTSKTFNPFGLNYWLGIPYRTWQYWFPYFRPIYYPPNLMKPPRPNWWGNKPEEDCGPKPVSENIFGISGPPGEDVEYLPPADQIDWGL